ncbi:MAG: hypothetical protein RIR70_1432 [Pseudomonadota bacterium]|jgi:Flp pilus assembly protein TadD/ketosteroid isomerase-like protein
MRSWFKPAVFAMGMAFGAVLASPAWAADPVEEVFSLVSKGQYRQALTNVDRILEGSPKDLNARFMRGVILSELNRPDEAIEAFKALITDQPDLPEPYNNLAALFAQQRRYLDARDALEKAIRINPAYTTALENLGDLYLRLAGDVYAKAKNLEDASPETTRKLASVKNLIGGARDTQVAAAETPAKKPAAETAAPAATPAPAALAKSEDKPIAAKGKKGGKTEVAKVEPPKLEAPKIEPPKAEPKPEAKPEPKSEPTQTADASSSREPAAAADGKEFDGTAVEQAVRNWAGAWASKDVDGYLAAYAQDFRPPTGGRAQWENQRRERITKPETISIEIEGLTIKQKKGKAVATFTQHYRSPLHKSEDNKTLVMALRDGEWRIVEERVAK